MGDGSPTTRLWQLDARMIEAHTGAAMAAAVAARRRGVREAVATVPA